MKVWICQPLDDPHRITVHATMESADAAWAALGGTCDAYVFAREVQGGRDFADGLDAARDAVAALDACPECAIDSALGAIDSLRGVPVAEPVSAATLWDEP